jgi:hypothetical protein
VITERPRHAACGEPPSQTDADRAAEAATARAAVVIRGGPPGEPERFDPRRSGDSGTHDVPRDLSEGLTAPGPDPMLAPPATVLPLSFDLTPYRVRPGAQGFAPRILDHNDARFRRIDTAACGY